MTSIRNEDRPEYNAESPAEHNAVTVACAKTITADNAVLKRAKEILAKRLIGRRLSEEALIGPSLVKQYLDLELAEEQSEVFAVLFLDTQHRPIALERMFNGTIDGASVYPREVAKEALRYNAGAVILAHNHPSGSTEPSHADIKITEKLTEALGLIEVRVLDHIVVGEGSVSFAERGLIS